MAEDKETDSPQPLAKMPRPSCADTSAGKYARVVRSVKVAG